MTKSKNLVFFGTEEFSLHTLKKLVADGWKISLVVTKPDARKGRGRIMAPPAVKQFAIENNLPVVQPDNTKSLEEVTKAHHGSTGVLSAYGKILPESVLSSFPAGIINVHPSLLPSHRGASPIEQTILSGDKQAGVSIMKLAMKMDAGPVYVQKSVRLYGNETASELYDKLGELGAQLLCDNLSDIISGKLVARPQNESDVTYAPMLNKQDGQIDWNKSAEVIERQIRAYNVWPQSRTLLGEKEVIITDAYASNDKSANGEPGSVRTTMVKETGLSLIKITCGHGLLNIQSLKPVGKREMTAGEFLAGNRL